MPVNTRQPGFDELAWTLFELCTADQMFIYRRNDAGDALDPFLSLGSLSLQDKQSFWSSQFDSAADPLVQQWKDGAGLVVRSGDLEPGTGGASVLAGLRAQNWAVYPLSNHGQLLGLALIGWFMAGRGLDEQQAKLARVITRTMALEIDAARLNELAGQQAQQALIARQITQAILRRDDLLTILQFITGEGVRAAGAMGGCIRLLDENGELKPAVQVGQAFPSPLQAENSGGHPSNPAGRQAAWISAAEPGETGPLVEAPDSGAPSAEERSVVMIAPMRSGDKTIGFLEIAQLEIYTQAKDLPVLQSFANQAAVAVELDGLYKSLQRTTAAEERARLGRDLHDSISQSLYALTLYARAAQRQMAEGNLGEAEKHIHELDSTAREALGEMRILIYELRPMALERYGLKGILEQRLQSVEGRSGLATHLEVDLREGLPPQTEENLYHIIIEALNNTIKHAQARQVWVRVWEEPAAEGLPAADGQPAARAASRTVKVLIRDDGTGFDLPAGAGGGQGLRNIQERVEALHGKLTIETSVGVGVKIEVEVRV